MSGWILLHRSIQKHSIWQKKPFTEKEAWIDMIMTVNHKSKKVLIKGIEYLCGRGESVKSLDKWAKQWGWHKSKVRRFFDKLENVTCKRVVVATSGKYLYKGDEFNGRDIIYDRTCELTYYADMVLGHESTAIGYAAVMKKPLVFLTIDELSDSAKKETERFAQVFEKKVMDIDEDFNIAKLSEFSEVTKSLYERFVQNYMASQPFTLSSSEVIISTLKGIHN